MNEDPHRSVEHPAAHENAGRPMTRRDHYICAALAGCLASSWYTTSHDIIEGAIHYGEAVMREADRSAKGTDE